MSMDGAAIADWMARVEGATRKLLPEAGTLAWLLRQSTYTHMQRLAVLPVLGLTPGPMRVLDVGAGTGALCLDVARVLGSEAKVVAVDSDPESISLLQRMADDLQCRVESRLGSAYELPVDSSSQDLTVSRFLLQHLAQPEEALAEMVRVTAPGGRIAVMEVDDGAGISYPPMAPVLERLHESVRQLQAFDGGDRYIGRRLYGLFRSAGLVDLQVLAVPRVRLGISQGRNPELEMHQQQYFLEYREPIIEAAMMSAAEFDEAMAEMDAMFSEDGFGFACEFLAVGRVGEKS